MKSVLAVKSCAILDMKKGTVRAGKCHSLVHQKTSTRTKVTRFTVT